ncbi:amphiphysin-like [Amphibalanus amphitrite]|uniref:amphiphysin-like n=1 Tax=Amphibalanus amphitrite TaxID=1232801 RepID=UPI001C90496E|nr:amphiphysin-like [Amphibalanus amphitrite]
MDRRSSHRSQRAENGRRSSRDKDIPGPSEWEPSPRRQKTRNDSKGAAGTSRRGSRTAPPSPETGRRSQLTARPHSSEREIRQTSPSRSRQFSRQEPDNETRGEKSRDRDHWSRGDGRTTHKTSSKERRDDPEFQERQLGVYQKALKEQIVQSDHLIKAIYRFSDCIDMTEKAMRNLHDVMGDYWEDDWPGAEKYYITLQDQEELWDRYEQSMRKLLDPIREYEGQFEGAEDKIEEYQEVRRQYSQACASLEELRRRRAAGHDITFAESDRDRIGQRYEQLVSFLGEGLPSIIASRIPFMEKLFYQLSNNLLQFCLETCKVQSKSCEIVSRLRSYDLSMTLGEGRSRTTIRAPARHSSGGQRRHSAPGGHAGEPRWTSRRK